MVTERADTMQGRSGSMHGGLSRLLIVDDDPALLDALSGTLDARFSHFSLDTCDSGARALDLAKHQRYDTIIVDVNMPGMSGFDVLTAVKALQPQTPVLLMTAHADETMMAKAFEEGAAAFIPKPFDRAHLVNAARLGVELSRLQSATGTREQRAATRDKITALRHELRQQSVRILSLIAIGL